ncbi:hypothetical protein BDF20DRAFT_838606 [Mycotypha africana]|uniref:uncharacterized protein n=1 Tax=Mycotypha africana TaxID=64632 RepID=UPI0023005177|nr:uncharacterized protein BDF20DRAFT_838606 [Mycotypha africana]KAI8970229.1 hypothetical protein BDF20DRAFT_838606 [Mycotypha africana]
MFKLIILEKKRQFLKTVKQVLLKYVSLDAISVDCKKKVISPKTNSIVIFTKHPLLMMLVQAETRKEDRALMPLIRRLPPCHDHNPRETEVFKQNLGDTYQAFARRIPFDNCPFDDYRDSLKEKIIEASSTVCYLKPTTTLKSITCHLHAPKPSYQESVSVFFKACTEIATSCLYNIVENFEQRLVYFLKFKLQMMFVFTECKKSLAVNPGCFVSFLFLINDELEKEHAAHKSYDVGRLPLSRLFSVLPTASIRWRFVTVSVNALSCFIRQKLPHGCQDQLELFYRILKFQSLRYRNLSSLTPNGSNTVLFGNIMRIDGFSIDFLFFKRRHVTLASAYKTLDLSLDDLVNLKSNKHTFPFLLTLIGDRYQCYCWYSRSANTKM